MSQNIHLNQNNHLKMKVKRLELPFSVIGTILPTAFCFDPVVFFNKKGLMEIDSGLAHLCSNMYSFNSIFTFHIITNQ